MAEKTFYLHEGGTFSNIKGFAKALVKMPGHVYKHHVGDEKNDFAVWTKYSLNNHELAERIDGQIDIIEMELEVLRHIVHDNLKSKKKSTVKKKVVPKNETVKSAEVKKKEVPKKKASVKKAPVKKETVKKTPVKKVAESKKKAVKKN